MRTTVLFLWVCLSLYVKGQTSYTINPYSQAEMCTKGAAGVEIIGLQTNDTLSITWSNGQTNVNSISNLDAGDYNAQVVIKNKKDTTLTITVEKEKCRVSMANHFTPNGDNYNDVWQVGGTQYFPKFELYVFNKWGQQVHSQKGTFEPWDGKWNGVNVLDGTYYYVFYYDGGNKRDLEKGDITILR